MQPINIAPLVSLRFIFGVLMFISIIRFWAKGWITELYLQPEFFFPYYGFEWVQPLSETGMYSLFLIMAVSAIGIALGAAYRLSAITFFLAFTYVELIDKTNYLNHYYFVSLISFLLIWVPANKAWSIDAWLKLAKSVGEIPRYLITLFQIQIAVVYFFAGVAKLNPDWMLEALPLRLWLPAHGNLPIIGDLLTQEWLAYALSWSGALFDIVIAFFLFYKPTRLFAYIAVVSFHLVTGFLFPIGMFPFIMIGLTTIFFAPEIHKVLWEKIWKPFATDSFLPQPKWQLALFSLFIAVQLVLPLRSMFYSGELFWTEQGYRFSWRVMLMEKAGTCFFYVENTETGRRTEVLPSDYLTPNQEKMMSTQPDMILQFAHFLGQKYKTELGFQAPKVFVKSYVTLQGRGSKLFIDPNIDLMAESESLQHKSWILPYSKNSTSAFANN